MSSSRFLGLVPLCALLLLGACREQPKAAAPAVPEVTVRTLQSQSVPLRTELPGRTAAFMVAEVRPQVGGIIRSRPFTEGAAVKAGQVLYEIDPAPFQAAVQQQEGALANARATVSSTRALAERYKALLPQNAVSKQEHDNAQAAYEQAQAAVKVQTALLNTARINLQYTQVKAPIAGRTSRSSVTPGALVSASQATPLLTISQLDPIYVDITQSSAELVRMRQALMAGRINRQDESQRVSLVMEDGTPYPAEGRVQLTEVTVDPSSGSVTLRARFPNPDGLLLPGMYVRAVVTEGATPDGILVPQAAIIRDRRGTPQARLVTAENKLELRNVVVARSVGQNWLVSEGLKPGDRLVMAGGQNVQPGTTVKPVDEPPAAAAAPQNGTPVSPTASGAATGTAAEAARKP
ncbi:MAG: efflux RND transporter periplasmic adaptor subunit [Rhodocyclaceae bacterium]|nr:efflux RND transporter periplasmic adaptor subunit [Pseudomonadota bacterium]MDQ7973577.1 efflux RND transporter periplasmic adaptor subunit [Rhodocyclaceae bacterium]MDQ8001687.1 efflux RND transporter periplasmic adaptor subunit [Pseudomonadota bacterium]MDQ8016953.1 efflux RND transporter periplasmic adaptor subunit [Pseudomonadota bacterium]